MKTIFRYLCKSCFKHFVLTKEDKPVCIFCDSTNVKYKRIRGKVVENGKVQTKKD